MSESNRVQVSYLREDNWGVTPSADFQAFPITGGSFPQGQETVRSATLRSDAQLGASKRVGLSPTASYDFEFTAQVYDEFIRQVIRADADWSTDVDIGPAADIQFQASGNIITSTTGHFDEVQVGQWIRVSGAIVSDGANNGWWRVTTVADIYNIVVAGGSLVDETPAATVIRGSQVLNGSALHSVSLQEHYLDLTARWRIMRGCRPNAFSLEQTEGGIITGSVAFDGRQREQAAAGGGTGAVTGAPDKDVASEVDGFDSVWIDDTVVSVDVFTLSMAIATGNRPRKGLGSLPRTAMGMNSPEITGAIEMFLSDDSWTYDADLGAFNKFRLAFAVDMQNGDHYLFDLPQVVLTDEPATNPGLDSDMMFNPSFQAEPGGAYGATALEKTIQVCRVLAP